MITSEEVREQFIRFFTERGHRVVPSSSLIPENDPSVLLTTAGMQQFKPYFTGARDAQADFGSQRLCSIQKSFRTTDIDEVGDETHNTFFEMLGNFSFGDGADEPSDRGTTGYFKRAAIQWAREFIEEALKLKLDYTTVFEGEGVVPFDQVSFDIWRTLGLPADRIKRFGRADNFWGPTGDEGPCGPTTELYLQGVEVWNVVFNEYYQDKVGKLRPLERHGVDTGMGLERLLKVIQGVPTIFETDLFEPLRTRLAERAPNLTDRTRRIILDHVRSSAFLIADGVYPSNLERGYVLRRILRRLTLQCQQHGVQLDWLPELLAAVSQKYSGHYPELSNHERISRVAQEEAGRFGQVLMQGLRRFDRFIAPTDSAEIIGEKFFTLYTSYGLPIEISAEVARQRGYSITDATFRRYDDLFRQHQKISH